MCHNCEPALLSGDVACTAEPLDPPTDGTVLICSARPRGAAILDL